MAYKRRFTLIELIAVMGLIGLIVGLAAPSFSRMNKGQSVNIAAETVRNALEQAQAQAISHHRYVGLIIPNGSTDYFSVFASNDTPDFNASTKNKYNLASFRSAFLWKDGSDYEFAGWVPQSEWSTPLENARIVKITKVYDGVPKVGTSFTDNVSSTTTPLREETDSAFKKIKDSASSPNPDGSIPQIGPCVIVFTPDGSLAAPRDLFLVVQGCTLNGTKIEYTGNGTNYFVLHVNRMNGKVSYFQKPNSTSDD